MSRIQLSLLRTLAVGGLLSAMAIPASAQYDADGLIRISDSSPGQLSPVPSDGYAYGGPDCPTCPQSVGFVSADGHYGHPHYGPHYSRTVHQILDWFNPYGMCTFSPDHGFSPPVKRPIFRSPVVYRKAFPDEWTGAPQAGAPVKVPTVYMPTDTTQLGYYYQHVPYWLPRPGAIPPAPQPEAWHTPMSATALGPHDAGLLLGTAPVIGPDPGPFVPTPASYVRPDRNFAHDAGGQQLERSAFNPSLLPIE